MQNILSKRFSLIAFGSVALLGAAGIARAVQVVAPAPTRAFAVVSGPGISGTVSLQENTGNEPLATTVDIVGNFSGLSAGLHGVQITSAANCNAAGGFSAAGSVLELGGAHSRGSESGEVANLFVSNGRGSLHARTSGVSILGPRSVFHGYGAAIVIHSGADTGISDGGPRVACGVIHVGTPDSPLVDPVQCDAATEVAFGGSCYYLDGSGGACDAGYHLVSDDILGSIRTSFIGKTYKHAVSDNCCIWNADPDEDWGMNDHCNSPGLFDNSDVALNGANCTDAMNHQPRQLTLCGSN